MKNIKNKTGIALATPVFYKLFGYLFFFRLGTGSFLNGGLLTQRCLPVKTRSQLSLLPAKSQNQ